MRIARFLQIVLLFAMWLFFADPQLSIARSFRINYIPNGLVNLCSNCHINPGGGGARNAFGLAVEPLVAQNANAEFWSSTLAKLDSDGDGFTNGQELQDPNGTWKKGDTNPGDAKLVTNAGDANSHPAGQEPTPTLASTPTPIVIPTLPVLGGIIHALTINEFDKTSLADNGWAEIPGGFDSAPPGTIAVESALNANIPSSKDGKGLLFTVKPGQVAFAYAKQAVVTNGGPALLRLTVRATSAGASLALAALRGSIADPALLDGSIGMDFPKSTKAMVDREYRLVMLYEPDQGTAINPVIQVASNSKTETVSVYVDKLEVYSIDPDFAKTFNSVP